MAEKWSLRFVVGFDLQSEYEATHVETNTQLKILVRVGGHRTNSGSGHWHETVLPTIGTVRCHGSDAQFEYPPDSLVQYVSQHMFGGVPLIPARYERGTWNVRYPEGVKQPEMQQLYEGRTVMMTAWSDYCDMLWKRNQPC